MDKLQFNQFKMLQKEYLKLEEEHQELQLKYIEILEELKKYKKEGNEDEK